jgi:hypothetical protein
VIHSKLVIFRRRLFTICSAISLLLCCATVVIWVCSYWRGCAIGLYDTQAAAGPRLSYYARSYWGCIELNRYSTPHASRSGTPLRGFRAVAWESPGKSYQGVFQLNTVAGAPASTIVQLRFPNWLAAILFAIAPTYWLLVGPRRRRAKRRKLGLCLHCGYDLRATPDRCPECGAVARSLDVALSHPPTPNR